jgi:hypothetical protein
LYEYIFIGVGGVADVGKKAFLSYERVVFRKKGVFAYTAYTSSFFGSF